MTQHFVIKMLDHLQPPIQWVPGSLSLRVKQVGHEADHSPPSSAEVNMPSWCCAQLKHRDCNYKRTRK